MTSNLEELAAREAGINPRWELEDAEAEEARLVRQLAAVRARVRELYRQVHGCGRPLPLMGEE